MHDSPPHNPDSNPRAPAGQSIFNPEQMVSPFSYAMVPGGFVPIPQHIRPFLDTTHEPTEGGLVPNRRPNASDYMDIADNYYYKIRRLSPVRHPVTKRILSAYSGVELKPDSRFSGHQFDEYIFHAARKNRFFMFRVEKQAALTGHRHPRGLESTKCRFAKCPIDGTIRPGQIRVCISEFLDLENTILDPYHNAGYVHLYCLEKFCNLPSLLAETKIPFLPAGQLAKESSFPPALNATEQAACLQWASQARQDWVDFKRRFPSPETRPRYNPPEHDRLHHRLDQIRETQKAPNKRRHAAYVGPQVYTYNGRGQQNPAPEPALKKLRTVPPPRIPIPTSSQNSGYQIHQSVPALPYQTQQPIYRPQIYQTDTSNNVPTNMPKPVSPGQFLPSGSAEDTQGQLSTSGAGNPGQGAEYSTEEINSLMVQDWVNDLANYSDLDFEECSWRNSDVPPAAGLQDDAGPEERTLPEQATQPVQGNQPVATIKIPVVTESRRKPRRSSAPPALSIQNARVRKSAAARRTSSKTKDVLVTQSDLKKLHKGR